MPQFKIAAAQVASVCGDLDRNIATHAATIIEAAKHEVSMLVFPELSLTSYEPELAAGLAILPTDHRLTPLISLARQYQIEVVLGAPLLIGKEQPALGAIIIASDGRTQTYCKMHLGGCEPNYFISGERPFTISVNGHRAGIAICADASRSTHPQGYAHTGADIYAAGVFLNSEWYATDAPRLASYAARFGMLVVMANHADSTGKYTSVGQSAIWDPSGAMLAQVDGTEDALVIAASENHRWQGEVVRI